MTAEHVVATPADKDRKDGSAPAASPVGTVVATGTTAACGELVLWFEKITEAALPQITFGVMAGCRATSGALTAQVMANETEGSDRAPGFHAVQAGMNTDGTDTLTFGYYAGPAAKITGTIDGRTAQASQAAWSEDPQIIVFWFPPDGAHQQVSNLAAYDATGTQLPAGHTAVGQG